MQGGIVIFLSGHISSISSGIKSFWYQKLEVPSCLLVVNISQFANIRILTSLKYQCRAGRRKPIEFPVTRNKKVNNVSVYILISNACDFLGREVCTGHQLSFPPERAEKVTTYYTASNFTLKHLSFLGKKNFCLGEFYCICQNRGLADRLLPRCLTICKKKWGSSFHLCNMEINGNIVRKDKVEWASV